MQRRRLIVAFLSVLAGVLGAVLDIAVAIHFMPPEEQPRVKVDSPEEHQLIFEACVTFYGIAYLTGRLLYRLLGRSDDAAELQYWSRRHMQLLHFLGGLWLVVSGLSTLHNSGVFRPAAFVGLVLIALAIRDAWTGRRRLQKGPR